MLSDGTRLLTAGFSLHRIWTRTRGGDAGSTTCSLPGQTAGVPQNRAFRLSPRRPEVCRPGSFVRAMFGSGESRSSHSRRP